MLAEVVAWWAAPLGAVLGLALGLPPVAWAIRRDTEDRLGKPPGSLKGMWWGGKRA